MKPKYSEMQVEPPPFTNKKYGVIYADPPWSFKTYSETNQNRAATNHYPVMSLDDICYLDVGRICLPDCVLLVWVTDPMLKDGLNVIDCWGFKYKTVAFTWVKLNQDSTEFMGTGYWTRANPEMCLLATRGHPKRENKSVTQLTVAKRREHSRKPEIMYRKIERLVKGPYIELFARTQRAGWDSWGIETDKF